MKQATMITAATLGSLLALLAGCASQDTASGSQSTSATSPRSVFTPSFSPTPESVPVRCSDGSGYAKEYSSYTAAWPAKATNCEGVVYGPVTEEERKAIHVAYNTNGDDGNMRSTLYGMRAQNNIESWSNYLPDASHEQAFEVQGMLTLCPEHPLAGQLNAMLATATTNRQLRDQGRIFGEGVFKVGSEIKAGTYVASSGKGCYWERQTSSGSITDNGFHQNSARVQVTIRSSDYAFMSRGCGEWKPVS